MFGKKLPRQVPGAPIEARTINRPLDVLEALMKIAVAAPLELQRIGMKILIRDASPRGRWIKIASGSNPYAWTEAKPEYNGTSITWVTTGLPTGTTSQNPAFEVTGRTTVAANTYHWAEATPAGALVFKSGAC